MGVFDNLFGGGGTDVQQISTLTPGQGNTLEAVVQQILSQFQGGQLQGITPFQGQRPGEVPFGQLQQQGFGLAGGLAPGIGAGLNLFGPSFGSFDPQQGQNLLQQGQQAIQGASQPFDPQSILSALEPGRQLALRTFNRDIVPNILERFGATSGSSGALNRAFAEAGQGLSLGLSAQASPFLFQGQQNQLNRQFAGGQALAGFAGIPGQIAGQGVGLGNAALGGLNQLFNFGGQQQGLQQGIAGANQARFNEAQPFNNPFLGLLPQALNTPAFTNIVQPQGQSAAQSLLPELGTSIGGAKGGFLGGGGGGSPGFGETGGLIGPAEAPNGGGSIFGDLSPTGSTGSDIQMILQIAAMFSDNRIKENVKPIDNALDKVKQLSGSTYNYKFNEPGNRNGGIMAQDLEKVLPDAVSEIDGIKYVRYDAVIGLLVNAVNELARKVA
ncbi:hypothetical protein LCGC14_0600550 [marine sediment metagenome]|uniref:Peptidase S74 domain-containing protein n=1 Tax=marine sediment metagenome TaxID=412755 RepID=A0A0F9RFG5_9ZZZZ